MDPDLYFEICNAAHEVHRVLGGPGLLENIYESALSYELTERGIANQRQVPIPVIYKKTKIREPLYLDILINNQLIIEVKATGKDFPYYYAQLATHLRLANIPYGLLINFGKEHLDEGIIKMSADSLVAVF